MLAAISGSYQNVKGCPMVIIGPSKGGIICAFTMKPTSLLMHCTCSRWMPSTIVLASASESSFTLPNILPSGENLAIMTPLCELTPEGVLQTFLASWSA